MMLDSENIELFKNLSEFDLNGKYYDFHNDFKCTNIVFENNCFILRFNKTVENFVIEFKFADVVFARFDFLFVEEIRSLAIDNIQRCRFEVNGKLEDFDNSGRSYFYIEFYEDIKFEFWCRNIILEEKE